MPPLPPPFLTHSTQFEIPTPPHSIPANPFFTRICAPAPLRPVNVAHDSLPCAPLAIQKGAPGTPPSTHPSPKRTSPLLAEIHAFSPPTRKLFVTACTTVRGSLTTLSTPPASRLRVLHRAHPPSSELLRRCGPDLTATSILAVGHCFPPR